MNTKEIIDSIYVSLDDDKVETAVRNCLRLARAAGDHFYAGVFLRQLCHDRDEFFAAYYDDIHHLKEEDQKSLVDLAGKRWLKTRSLSFSLGTDAEGNDLNFITASAGSQNTPEDALRELHESAGAPVRLPTAKSTFLRPRTKRCE